MGQGASTPQNDGREIQNHGASRSSQQDEATGSRGTQAQSTPETRPDETTTALRRSRRLRNHIDHFARIGSRLLPNSSTSSTSSSVSSRMHNIRNRRSRLPSPSSTPGGGSSPNRTSLSSRQRIRGYTSRPQSSFDPEIRNSTGDVDMVDISAVPSGDTRTPTPPTPSFEAPATESRRSRMARVRSSIPSWPDLIGSRRPGHSNFNRNSALLSYNNNISSSADMDTDMPHAEVTPSSQSSDSSPSRLERTAGGSGNLMEEYDNPARVRPGEDQAAMLSRLLSVAAAATAASLVGNTEQAITEAQDVAGDNGGDGSFESFLRALQNGRLAAALRNGGNELGGGAPPDANQADNTLMAPLNFFRMFRFGSTNNNEGNGSGESGEGSRSRMVPVIIVGIRSVTPRDSTDGGADRPAPFFDALANLPVNLPSIRRPRLSNNHRRASMGGTPASPSGYDSQRHSRATSSNSLRPVSDISPASIPILSDTSPGPHPPPSTPADPSLLSFPNPSFSNGQTSAERSEGSDENMSSGARDPPSRRRLSRRLSSSDSIPPFSALGGRSAGSSNNNSAGSSSSAAGSGSGPRRPLGNAEGTRSWIIYVLGGSYPEDHPILTTPSLFTDAPTYEDMMLLSSLLGPAKPPVATRDDVNSAGGIFVFGEETTLNVSIAEGDRCLICLGDYEKSEECRLLSKCQHVFHRECIDEWLTTGRNSCPLCRSQGVNEKEQPPTTSTDAPPANSVDGTAAS
ncbi:uncharacterized protein H6S33_001680 [Morchella sextelata]|uniref:uncharacterized protein n=1 Tax=Morchella sextelata TaxID=1174677 RepID=UPI001D040EBA|nr:uncharacterized protein H6S33_001680 [Morchella sextelata]KAH0608546.1 hypothetical protein H6S33_001680 [Morchella sextelata]